MLPLSNLAAVYSGQGRYDQAVPLFKRGLAVLEKANGPDDPEATVLMSNLADAYINRHRYADAERLLKRAMAVTTKAYGPDHPDVAQALNNLAALYARQGRNTEAERLFKQSVATMEKTLGPNHPDLADVLDNLAGLYKDQGRYADARGSHQAVDGHPRQDGRDLNHPDAASAGRVPISEPCLYCASYDDMRAVGSDPSRPPLQHFFALTARRCRHGPVSTVLGQTRP